VISFILEDTKQVMQKLLKEEVFDEFLCVSFELVQLFKVHVDGQVRKDFLDTDDTDRLNELTHIRWKDFKAHAFNLIRGQKPPTSMKITFSLHPNAVHSTLERIRFNESQAIGGFIFTLNYEDNKIRIITGTNYASFTLDKTAEQYFDDSMLRFFKKQGISTLLALD